MRRFELIVKEVSHPKLTVAMDRTTLKLPSSLSTLDRQRIEALAKKIHDEHPTVELTLRGRFFEGGIKLSPESSNPEVIQKFGKVYSYEQC